MNARVVDAAAGEGLLYRYDIAKRANTFDAHRLIHLAAAVGLQPEMKERLMAAYFMEGRAIGDRDTLVELAGEVGIDVERARATLDSDLDTDDVRADERAAAELGLTGGPFFAVT